MSPKIIARRVSILVVLLLPEGSCSSDSTIEETDGGSTAPSVVSYAWKATWGPCLEKDAPCTEVFVVSNEGGVSYKLRGIERTGALDENERNMFRVFLKSSVLSTAISEPKPCVQAFDRSEVVSLALDDGTNRSRDITGCSGALFEDIDKWNAAFRDLFP